MLQFEGSRSNGGQEGDTACALFIYMSWRVYSPHSMNTVQSLNAEDENVKLSRLKLASLTEKTLKQGLELLGIKTIEKM